jgi:hypothetical protein
MPPRPASGRNIDPNGLTNYADEGQTITWLCEDLMPILDGWTAMESIAIGLDQLRGLCRGHHPRGATSLSSHCAGKNLPALVLCRSLLGPCDSAAASALVRPRHASDHRGYN